MACGTSPSLPALERPLADAGADQGVHGLETFTLALHERLDDAGGPVDALPQDDREVGVVPRVFPRVAFSRVEVVEGELLPDAGARLRLGGPARQGLAVGRHAEEVV